MSSLLPPGPDVAHRPEGAPGTSQQLGLPLAGGPRSWCCPPLGRGRRWCPHTVPEAGLAAPAARSWRGLEPGRLRRAFSGRSLAQTLECIYYLRAVFFILGYIWFFSLKSTYTSIRA